MKKVFIVHGFGGTPNAGWLPWLTKELGIRGVYACVLPMPESKWPVLSKWLEEVNHAVENSPNDEIILVGHSLGAATVLKYLEQYPEGKKFLGVVLVSGFFKPLDPEDPESNYRRFDSFFSLPVDFGKIKNKANKFFVLHSTDDPAVPFSNAEEISKTLDCELIKKEKGGHFFILSEPICYELPELLEIVLKIVNI